jgi:hypothetical protein
MEQRFSAAVNCMVLNPALAAEVAVSCSGTRFSEASQAVGGKVKKPPSPSGAIKERQIEGLTSEGDRP